MELSRRDLFVMGGAAGVVLVGGWILYRDPARLVEWTVRRALPGVNISNRDIRQFSVDFASRYFRSAQQGLSYRALSIVSGVTGVAPLRSIGKVDGELAQMEREAVTAFLSYTDFFSLDDPSAEAVTYFGLDASLPCANPFARF